MVVFVAVRSQASVVVVVGLKLANALRTWEILTYQGAAMKLTTFMHSTTTGDISSRKRVLGLEQSRLSKGQ